MAVVFVLAWLCGLPSAGILSELSASKRSARMHATARLLFALGLIASLLVAAVVFASAQPHWTNPGFRATRGGWWWFVAIGALPVLALCASSARGAFRGRTATFCLACAAAATLFVLLPPTWVPADRRLHGIGLRVHEHHVLTILALLAPGLLLLADEVWHARRAPVAETAGRAAAVGYRPSAAGNETRSVSRGSNSG